MARALATQGALLLLQARATREPEARREAARRADDAFTAAVRVDPLLARELEPRRRAAKP
jgi:hypothetical protein